MAEAQERIGQLIGDYRLLSILGKGTFGTVYLAEHLHDHTPTAVKILHIPLTDHNTLHAFLNEARTIRLRHPHIVPILDFGVSRRDDLPYLAMAYADGGSLRDRYPKGSKLSSKTIDIYVQQLASALQYAHDQRIIHRDVKPENILLSRGTVQLSDFGIARISELASLSSLYKVAGTPAYTAPEQSQGKPSPASDQYALAVVVYEWLTGERPFQGDPLAVMLQHHKDVPTSLRSLCPEVSPQVEQVIFKALAKAPEDRFPTITHFMQALHAALQEDATQPLPHLDQSRSVPSPIAPVPSPDKLSLPKVLSAEPFALPKISLPPQPVLASPSSIETPDSILVETQQTSWPTPDLQKRPSVSRRRKALLVLLCLMLLLSGSGVTWLVVAKMHRPLSNTEIPQYIMSKAPDYPNTLNQSNGWLSSDKPGGSCGPLSNAGYKVTLKYRYYDFYKCTGDLSPANFALKVQMHLTAGHEGGILFRLTPQESGDQCYYFYIRADTTSWGFRKYPPQTPLAGGQSKAINPNLNTLFVVASDDTIDLYVNGVFLRQIHDQTYSQGEIALAAGSGPDNSQSEVIFSNMEVWSNPSLN